MDSKVEWLNWLGRGRWVKKHAFVNGSPTALCGIYKPVPWYSAYQDTGTCKKCTQSVTKLRRIEAKEQVT